MPIPTPKKISELDLAGALSGQEYYAIVQGGITKRVRDSTLQEHFDQSCKCTILSRSNTVGTDADTLTKYLHTNNFDADTLSNDNESIDIKIWGITGANNNTKTISVGFGSTLIYNISGAINNTSFVIDITLIRTSNTTQKAVGESGFNASNAVSLTNPTETLSADIPMYISASSAQNIAPGSANDVIIHGYRIIVNKLDPDS